MSGPGGTSTGDIGKPEQFLCGHSATANASVDNVGNTVVGNHGPSDQHALTKTQCGHSATTNADRHHVGNAAVSSSGGWTSNAGITGLLA
ncbi:hypothetical protein Tco_0118074 [Tanacetum coccineum]